MKDIENTELYNRMNSDNPPVVVKHHQTGHFYISPKFATVVGIGSGDASQLIVYTSGKTGGLYVTTPKRFFGKTETGEFRFTEFNV